MLSHDIPIEHVSKMLGHTNITQTQRYAKVLAQSVYDDFSKVPQRWLNLVIISLTLKIQSYDIFSDYRIDRGRNHRLHLFE